MFETGKFLINIAFSGHNTSHYPLSRQMFTLCKLMKIYDIAFLNLLSTPSKHIEVKGILHDQTCLTDMSDKCCLTYISDRVRGFFPSNMFDGLSDYLPVLYTIKLV